MPWTSVSGNLLNKNKKYLFHNNIASHNKLKSKLNPEAVQWDWLVWHFQSLTTRSAWVESEAGGKHCAENVASSGTQENLKGAAPLFRLPDIPKPQMFEKISQRTESPFVPKPSVLKIINKTAHYAWCWENTDLDVTIQQTLSDMSKLPL